MTPTSVSFVVETQRHTVQSIMHNISLILNHRLNISFDEETETYNLWQLVRDWTYRG